MGRSPSRKIDAVVAGHICFDLIPTFPLSDVDYRELLIPGKLIKVSRLAISTGGPVSNTGLAIKKLGMHVELMGKIGTDFIGEAILERLKEEGLERSMTVVQGEESSYTVAIAPPGMDRMFLHNPGANNTFGMDDVDYNLVKTARLFHLGYPPLMEKMYRNDGCEMMEIFRTVKHGGTTTSLDMALPDPTSIAGKTDWKKILVNVLPWVDLYLPSLEETQYMLDSAVFMDKKKKAGQHDMLDQFTADELTALSDKLLSHGPALATLKSGFRGFYVRTAGKERLDKIGFAKPGDLDNWSDRELWSPSFHVDNFAGATGSGDSSIAGFLSAYLRGLSIERTLQYATAVGANNVTAPDALSGIKDWDTTTQQIDSGWKQNPLKIDTPGWHFNEEMRIWHGPNDKFN